MENLGLIIIVIVIGYLLGCISSAFIVAKVLGNIDIRKHGSGNAGATNAMRVLGIKIGFTVLIIDALKGVSVVLLALLVKDAFSVDEQFVVFQLILGAAAILGHVKPVFASFKGGKGVATLVGIIIILYPGAFLICLVLFLFVFITTRFVSLASLTAGIALPFVAILVQDSLLMPKLIFAIAVALFVPITHINNIRRLLRGEENRMVFKKK